MLEYITPKNFLKNSDCETTIIKFGATWCNPCQKIKPALKALNDECTKMNKVYHFIDVDVDEGLLLATSKIPPSATCLIALSLPSPSGVPLPLSSNPPLYP